MITPEFTTFGATKPTSPASFAVIVPALAIVALALPGAPNTSGPPAIALAVLISAVLATSPFTSTCDPAPNSTPFWLMITTLPLAVRFPSIRLAPPIVTRLIATALAEG